MRENQVKSKDWNAVASELRILTEIIVKASRRDTERRLTASEAGISGLQYGMLLILTGQDHTLSELSHLMHREPATLLPAVDALEDKGLIKRGHDARDRRRAPLSITRAGTELLDRVPLVDEHDALVNALMELGEPRVQRLLTLLQQLADHVSQDKDKTVNMKATEKIQSRM